jgi:ubiquinone/menaquinone biosynthesis C-methylase UbiE
MTESENHRPDDRDIVREHYASGYEADRLGSGPGQLEFARTQELLLRFLPGLPAKILDAGGGTGIYACWLAEKGYTVHLVDLVPLHVEKAIEASGRQPEAPLVSARVGDARSLEWEDASFDAVLLFGPLYHLTNRDDRVLAIREAYRVLHPGGLILATAISRFASVLDGLRLELLKDPEFAKIVAQDLTDGQHRNPTNKPEYFTDTFFHHPDELKSEIVEAGFNIDGIFGIEGPSRMAPRFDEWWSNESHREELLKAARRLESEPSMIGMSAHLMAVGQKKA